MQIYQLTKFGESLAKTPTSNMTPGWSILYFLRRHGGRATADQIKSFTNLGEDEVREALGKLSRGNNPAVRAI